MRWFVTISGLLFLSALLTLPLFDAAAQSVKIKRLAISMNQRPKNAPYTIINGLNVIGKGAKAYFLADTTGSGASVVNSFTWTFNSKPAGSNAAFDSTAAPVLDNSFTADSLGFYYVQVAVNGGKVAMDTVFASTYIGINSAPDNGCVCHSVPPSNATATKTAWSNTGHAKIFTQGISGQLNGDATINKGEYTGSCVTCHTIGWDVNANNNNFGYLAHTVPAASPNSWDSTWFKPYLSSMSATGSFYLIPNNDSTVIKALPAQLKTMGYVGCESCHGPLADHSSFTSTNSRRQTRAKSLDPGVCNQCHDGSTRHSIGSMYRGTIHDRVPDSTPPNGHATSSSCVPCHMGSTFVKWVDAKKNVSNVAFDAATDPGSPISCAVCHDPHTLQLRTATLDSLKNGYKAPAGIGGKGLLCMNCHQDRSSVASLNPNNPPYYGFINRFGSHLSPQSDMFLGANGPQFGDATLTGISTHTGLSDACVTCHMAMRNTGAGNQLPNHTWSMDWTDAHYDTTLFDPRQACASCHGAIKGYNDVKAFYDYDRNGKIEGVQTEIQGMLSRLKAQLPIDSTTGEPVTMLKDSLKVKGNFAVIQKIYAYYFVTNDRTLGIHNSKYAAAILYKALGWTPLFVRNVAGAVPSQFALDQNYPNPFNPTTNIRFSLPNDQHVKLDVYDVTGRLVKTILNEQVRAGNMEVTWDGTNSSGAKVASGIYLYRLEAGTFSSVKKMIMLK